MRADSGRLGRAMAVVVAGALLAACGGVAPGDEASESTTATAATTPVGAPRAPTAPSAPVGGDEPGPVATAPPAPASTTTPITLPTIVALPQPSAPPADAEAAEPVLALGTLAIPALGLERTLYEGIRLPTFDLGPGHWPGTALPGQPGNVVIGGHRTSANADFRHLDQLVPGDEVILSSPDGAASTYLVQSTEIIDPFAARIVNQTSARTATLFACHPPGSVRQRIVVHLAISA